MGLQVTEGFDITAEDMQDASVGKSEIQEFFKDTTIFIDGATGFLGRLTLEKILRTCSEVKKVYVLLRPKKGKDVQERFKEMINVPVFDLLRREQPHFEDKIHVLMGDCAEENLGLSEDDRDVIINEVNCIFHIAATLKFDEKIRTATYINVRSTRDVLHLAKKAKNLKSFVHVSTAYSNCVNSRIEEKFYNVPISGDKLLNLMDTLDDQYLDAITPTLLRDYPNSYVFTKAVAENIINEHGHGLPVAIVRPSIILATSKEPIAGWIDNFYGATGIIIGAALGLMRSLNANPDKIADLVPADHVVNTMIASAWDIVTNKSLTENKEKNFEDCNEVQIYNYVGRPENPMTWGQLVEMSKKYLYAVKSPIQVWHFCFALRPNKRIHQVAVLFLHFLPAYIIDFIARCIGKPPMMVKAYKKIAKFSDVLAYFSTQEWDFTNQNTRALYEKLSHRDKTLFYLSMSHFSWDEYFYTYVRGMRVYLLKDPLDTVSKGQVKYRILQASHYTLVTFLLFLLYKVLMFFYSLSFS